MDKFDKIIRGLEDHFESTPEKPYGCGSWIMIRPDYVEIINGIRRLREENERLKAK